MQREPTVEFNDFIGHYKGWFKEENLEQFFEFWEHVSRVTPPIIQTRQDAEGAHPSVKMDLSCGLNVVRYEDSVRH